MSSPRNASATRALKSIPSQEREREREEENCRKILLQLLRNLITVRKKEKEKIINKGKVIFTQRRGVTFPNPGSEFVFRTTFHPR